VYHFVLTYSNWETGTICYSESLETEVQGTAAAERLGAAAGEVSAELRSEAVAGETSVVNFVATRRTKIHPGATGCARGALWPEMAIVFKGLDLNWSGLADDFRTLPFSQCFPKIPDWTDLSIG
jgi:hypothetical protein